MMYNGLIPFTENGKLITYTTGDPPPESCVTVEKWGGAIHWQKNGVFTDELELVGVNRGRSALNMVLKSRISGRIYYMSMNQYFEHIKGNIITGNFVFAKKGSNYLLENHVGETNID